MNENLREETRKFIDEWRLETENYQNIGGTFVDVDSPEEKRKCDDAFKKSLEALKKNETESKKIRNNNVIKINEYDTKNLKTDPIELDRYRGTDSSNAELYLSAHANDVRYCPPWDKWLLWTGTHWRIDDRLDIERLAADIPCILYKSASDAVDKTERRQIASLASKMENINKQRSMLIAARHRITVHHSDLDKGRMLLTVKNGTINLETGELRTHSHDDLGTHCTDIEYCSDAESPTWLRFLNDVFGGDADLIEFVQRAVGYSLTGDVREQILMICHGSGSNGKSVFLNILRKLLGSLSWQAVPDLLLADKQRRHPTELADLFGKRLVICQETGDGRRFNETLVKQLTGGDAITARRMHEDNWSFEPTHKLWLSTNHKPEIRGTDHAIWRRIRLIPFTVTFSDDTEPRKDPMMEARLTDELPGILAWAVAGCMKWQRDGLRYARPTQSRKPQQLTGRKWTH